MNKKYEPVRKILVETKSLDYTAVGVAAFSCIITLVATLRVAEILYLDRGYFAVGGEVFFLVLIAIGAPVLLWKGVREWIL